MTRQNAKPTSNTFKQKDSHPLLAHTSSSFLNKLHSRTRQSQGSSFLDPRLENDLLAIFPHAGDKGLSRDHRPCEADLDILVRPEFGIDRFPSDAEEAETVQDGRLEAAHLCE
jgi:hypothetical protein